jgi:lipopolysaccharide transport system ATP-binding protein
MSSRELAVSVRDVSKRYMLTHKGSAHSTLTEMMLERLRHPFRRGASESFWALKDFNFDIHKGEVVGFVGRNGAGKSTLLKILSRITEPTTGEIELYGPVGSLLEIGTGFHPELSGRENIFLNGAILGMRRRDIQRQFDAIVDFAQVDKFLDTPVKRYSSGMYIRLAFAVAAHLNPEILIIDEVLAVGDVEFQKKCLGKMHDVASEGRTVLFVSHNMAAIRQLCTSVVYLETGRLVKHGPTDEVLDLYTASRQKSPLVRAANQAGLSFIDMGLFDARNDARTELPVFNRDYVLKVRLRADRPLPQGSLRLRFFDESGTKVSSIFSPEEGVAPFTFDGELLFTFRMPRLALFPGRYIVSLEVARPNDPDIFLAVEDALAFEVQPSYINEAMWAYERSHGVVRVADGGELAKVADDFHDLNGAAKSEITSPQSAAI